MPSKPTFFFTPNPYFWDYMSWVIGIVAGLGTVAFVIWRWHKYLQTVEEKEKIQEWTGTMPDYGHTNQQIIEEILATAHINPPSDLFKSLRFFDQAIAVYLAAVWKSELTLPEIQHRSDLVYRLRRKAFQHETSVMGLPIGETPETKHGKETGA